MMEFFDKIQLSKNDLNSFYKNIITEELERMINQVIPNLFFRLEVTDRFEQIVIYVPRQYVVQIRRAVAIRAFSGSFMKRHRVSRELQSMLTNAVILVVGE